MKQPTRIRGLVAFAVAAILLFPGVRGTPLDAQEPTLEELRDTYPPGLYAELTTPKGVIVISIAFGRVPMTAANFVGLAEGTIENQVFPLGTPFYDGTTFHRVAPGHVVQAGRPASDEATTPGYSLPNEIHPTLRHDGAGKVGLVNGGPHTGKSQFYITLGNRSYLDDDYTVFGEVFWGMDVVREIVPDDPIETVRIVRVGGPAGEFRPTTESFHALREEVRARVLAEEEAQFTEDREYLNNVYPRARPDDSGVRSQIIRNGRGWPVEAGDTLMIRYTGKTLRGLSFVSMEEGGVPGYLWPGMDNGQVFTYVVGETSINPGFDRVIPSMVRGEKRLVIVPSELGYDPVGYYGVERRGRPRFVIRPRSILIYEIEILAR